ncbi:CoA-binding protein [Chloroflexota bacterium]
MKVDFAKLDRAFNPSCVVVVGDKRDSNFMWLHGQSTFKGKLYSVQVAPEEIEGIKAMGVQNYTSLLDVPDPVDLVIVAVPRAITPRILDDCISKGANAAHFFTSGFSETDTEEGRKLEQQLIEKAKQANFHLIGPNCMGLFNPSVGIRQNREQYTGVSGQVGFIAQSGNHAFTFAREAHLQGVDISKSVSFGNGIVLDSSDYLEYFGQDPDIKVIGMYLEGMRNGRRFLQVLKEVARRKPVVIWKGGRTEEGGRAIASHTGSMAMPWAIWEAAVKQCGALKVFSMEELIDAVKALVYLSPVQGNRVGIAGGSGGQSVAIADVSAEAGLKVPLLTQASYDELATFYVLIGAGYGNPIDTGNVNRREISRIMRILEQDANVDNLVLLVRPSSDPSRPVDPQLNALVEVKERTTKPVMAIISCSFSPAEVENVGGIIQRLKDSGIPAFTTFERGARALRNALDYYNLKKSISV